MTIRDVLNTVINDTAKTESVLHVINGILIGKKVQETDDFSKGNNSAIDRIIEYLKLPENTDCHICHNKLEKTKIVIQKTYNPIIESKKCINPNCEGFNKLQ